MQFLLKMHWAQKPDTTTVFLRKGTGQEREGEMVHEIIVAKSERITLLPNFEGAIKAFRE